MNIDSNSALYMKIRLDTEGFRASMAEASRIAREMSQTIRKEFEKTGSSIAEVIKMESDKSAAKTYSDKASNKFEEYNSFFNLGKDGDISLYESKRSEIKGDEKKDEKKKETGWRDGVKSAFDSLKKDAEDFATPTNAIIKKVFNGAEDAIVSFVKTGKMSFSDLADSIISDLTRMVAKQAVSGIMSGLAGWFENFSSGGYTGPGGKYEVAGIVHRDEGVLSKEDMAALGGPSGFYALRRALRKGYANGGVAGQPGNVVPLSSDGAGGMKVEVNNYGGGKVQTRQVTQQTPDGGTLRKMVIDIVGESLDGGELSALGRARYGWAEVVG
ncbi:phage tail tape measure C-terminal domain-containing protein [[Pseudomonas] boreopolis]|uniref:phage tail tape measure C-terminal domain-containing protein n=1 Tax=Xanthomonas boreopolis TaxID=86183 RepID=UPI003DA1B6ED